MGYSPAGHSVAALLAASLETGTSARLADFANTFAESIHFSANSYDHTDEKFGDEVAPDITVTTRDDGSLDIPNAETDCSTWVSYALDTVAPLQYAVARQFKETTTSATNPNGAEHAWPRAFIYQQIFSGDSDALPKLGTAAVASGAFEQVSDFTQLIQGDVIAWSLGDFAEGIYDSEETDTGHVMIVAGDVTVLDVSTLDSETDGSRQTDNFGRSETITSEAVKIVEIPIVDSTVVQHNDEQPGERTLPGAGGIGQGTIRVAVDAEGSPLQFQLATFDGYKPVSGYLEPGLGTGGIISAGRLTESVEIGTDALEVEVFDNVVTWAAVDGETERYGTFDGTVTGASGGDGGLEKTGGGRFEIAGTASYAGATTVADGTLSVTGSITGTGMVTVQDGATLAGTGSIAGAVSVESGATLAPGDDIDDDTGQLTLASGLSLADGATLAVGIESRDPGDGHDQVVVAGSVSLGGATLSPTFSGTTTHGDSFVLVDNDGSDAVSGTLRSTSGAALADGDTFTVGDRTYQISYSGGTGNDVVLVDVTAVSSDGSIVDGSTVTTAAALLTVPTGTTLSSLSYVPSADAASGGTLHVDLPDQASITDFSIDLSALSGAASDGVLDVELNHLGTVDTATITLPGLAAGERVSLTVPAATSNVVLSGDTPVAAMLNDNVNIVTAGAGDDTVSGLGGDDVLTGAVGSDLLLGNAGDDDLYGGSGADSLHGGQGNDALYGDVDADALYGGAGNDALTGGAGDDALSGGSGDDLLYGGIGNDLLDGGTGNDTLMGGAGDDTLDGGAGTDRLSGNVGDDILSGGGGDDTLFGDDGSDVFAFGASSGADVIEDFSVGTDTIRVTAGLNGSGIETSADMLSRITTLDDGSAQIDLGDGNTVTLSGVSGSALTEASFVVT